MAPVLSSHNVLDWCEGDGALMRHCIESPADMAVARLYFDKFHNQRDPEAMPSFAQTQGSGAALYIAVQLGTASFLVSALYAEIWRLQGFR